MSFPDQFPADDRNWEELLLAKEWTRVLAVGSPGVAFAANMTHYDTTTWGPVEWRMVGDELQLRGSAASISGVIPGSGSGIIAGLPAPPRRATFPVINSGAVTSYFYMSGDTLIFQGTLNSNWVPLDQVRYSTLRTTES